MAACTLRVENRVGNNEDTGDEKGQTKERRNMVISSALLVV